MCQHESLTTGVHHTGLSFTSQRNFILKSPCELIFHSPVSSHAAQDFVGQRSFGEWLPRRFPPLLLTMRASARGDTCRLLNSRWGYYVKGSLEATPDLHMRSFLQPPVLYKSDQHENSPEKKILLTDIAPNDNDPQLCTVLH